MSGRVDGQGYRYAHDYEDHFAPMRNLPERLQGRRYYTPTDQGYEAEVASRLARWWGGFYARDGERTEESGGRLRLSPLRAGPGGLRRPGDEADRIEVSVL